MNLIHSLFILIGINLTTSSKHDMKKFASTMRCPYASEWITKGPEEALNNLKKKNEESGLFQFESHRKLFLENKSRNNQEVDLKGSCAYTNAWTNSETCIEYRGLGWSSNDMLDNCNRDTVQGMLKEMEGCNAENAAGWCIKKVNSDMLEATLMELSNGMDCDMINNACTTFAGGDYFEPDGSCLAKEEAKEEKVEVTEENTCGIAPGPIGAAHQSGYSQGYRINCPETPAESSPYQWPLRWSANYKMESLKYNTDEVSYTSEAKVYYMLDKNWKRVDILRQKGSVPFFLQSTEEDEYLDQEERSTIIHRGDKMYFISYYNGTYGDSNITDIQNCTYLSLGVVGNIRPDWFLDKRGSATDVQYLGNQHVYYSSKGPRLVKQWRKQDFADMYFTMSMKGNVNSSSYVTEAGIHWPLILNVPGEGFGDDSIQYYSNHALLTEKDRDLFWLDEAYEQAGGSCPEQSRVGDGGPPVGMEEVPSMLMKDEHAWRSIEYTFSPVWEGEAPSTETDSSIVQNDDTEYFGAITKASDHVSIQTCHDMKNNNIKLQVTYADLSSEDNILPWVGLAFRTKNECTMFPRDSQNGTESILVFQDDDKLTPYQYYITRDTMSISPTTSETPYKSNPLSNVSSYSNVKLTSDENSITLSLVKNVHPDDAKHLTYAIGTSNQFGYHKERTCFTVSEYLSCNSNKNVKSEEVSYTTKSSAFNVYGHGANVALILITSIVVFV